MSGSLWPRGQQHARLPFPSLSPRVCSNSCPLNQWCHPTISSSVGAFSSCPQSFPASGSSPMSWLFTSGGQSIGASASTSVLPLNVQDWSPIGLNSMKFHCPVPCQQLSSTPPFWAQVSILSSFRGFRYHKLVCQRHLFVWLRLQKHFQPKKKGLKVLRNLGNSS